MAKFVYDVTNAPLLQMDFPLINDTYAEGEFLCLGSTDGTNIGTLKSGEGLYDLFAGVLMDDGITTTGTHSNRNVDEGRVCYNPFGVFRCQVYAPATSISVADADAGGTGYPAFTCTNAKGQPDIGGGWMYRTADPGAGELDFIASSAVSGTACTVTLSQSASTAITTSSDFILIYPPFTRQGIDLTATMIDGTDLDSTGGTAGTDGMLVSYMDNWIVYDGIGIQRLRSENHEHLTDLDNKAVKFYSDVCFSPSHFLTP